MPLQKKKITLPDGREVEGTVMPYQTGREEWNEYLVEDGTIIRMKLVATEIVRLDGEYDPQGNPAYVIQSTNVTSVSAPDDLKKEN